MTGKLLARRAFAVLGFFACTALAAPPREVFVTREVQDLYRIGTGKFYLKTIGCHENVFSDRAQLRLNISNKGGMLLFRNGKQCVVDKFLEDVDASKVMVAPALF